MIALISDIHGNLEALDAVLADIARRSITSIYCLGDLVGYGPNPVECVERATEWELVVLGNHDEALTIGTDGFSTRAARSLNWTRRQLAARPDLAKFLTTRPRVHRTSSFLFVHGTPRFPTTEYLFPTEVRDARKMADIGLRIDRYCFVGHTHLPGVFVAPYGPGGSWHFLAPEEIDCAWKLNTRKTIVNVGAVGQPRDKDRRACYAILNGDELTFHRVAYDVSVTNEKIRAIPELSDSLGERLLAGV